MGKQAAVVGSGLLSFMDGMTAQQRSAVQVATLRAEWVARSDTEGGLITDWFSHYVRQLKFLGWDATPPEEAHWPDQQRPRIIEAALSDIGAVAGEHYAVSMGLALKGLDGQRQALLHFEQRSREQGVFRLLPCAPAPGGFVDMVVYHELCETSQLSAGFLYRERRATQVRAQLVRFNTRQFDAQYRSKVEKALGNAMSREILSFEH